MAIENGISRNFRTILFLRHCFSKCASDDPSDGSKFVPKHNILATCCVMVDPPWPLSGLLPSLILILIALAIPRGLIPKCL